MRDDNMTSAEKLRVVHQMLEEAEVEELERIWGLEERATMKEQQELVAEADQRQGFILLSKPPVERKYWYEVGMVMVAILAAIAYAEFVRWLPRLGRLVQ